jgi:hypothetical protein
MDACLLNETRRRSRSTRMTSCLSWSGPAEVKDRLVAELNQCHTANRERLVLSLAQLRREARGLEPATPRRTDH